MTTKRIIGLIGTLSPMATVWLGSYLWNVAIPPYRGEWWVWCQCFDLISAGVVASVIWCAGFVTLVEGKFPWEDKP